MQVILATLTSLVAAVGGAPVVDFQESDNHGQLRKAAVAVADDAATMGDVAGVAADRPGWRHPVPTCMADEVLVCDTATSDCSCEPEPLMFGNMIRIENQHVHAGTKSFLDTACWAEYGHSLNVETTATTATNSNRSMGPTSAWKLEGLNGEQHIVSYGDQVRLVNQYGSADWYLKHMWPTNANVVASKAPPAADDHIVVWDISSAEGKSGEVRRGDKVHFQAQGGWFRGFLDTRGHATCQTTVPGSLEVSLSTSNNRDRGSGTWHIHFVPPTASMN